MWTPFVWLSEGVTNLYEGIAVPNFMRYLRGTPWLPLAFNLLGSQIGRGVYLDTTDITEFDCVTIGDYSELNALACPQTHLFEDRVMKIDHVDIGSSVYMGPRSAVLYSAGSATTPGSGALTLVMKGEQSRPAPAGRLPGRAGAQLMGLAVHPWPVRCPMGQRGPRHFGDDAWRRARRRARSASAPRCARCSRKR